jgi:hypothetical protein
MESFSVAAITMVPTSKGWPYTAPSRCTRQLTFSRPGEATPAATPLRAKSWP